MPEAFGGIIAAKAVRMGFRAIYRRYEKRGIMAYLTPQALIVYKAFIHAGLRVGLHIVYYGPFLTYV